MSFDYGLGRKHSSAAANVWKKGEAMRKIKQGELLHSRCVLAPMIYIAVAGTLMLVAMGPLHFYRR